jgi:hypothetical protein
MYNLLKVFPIIIFTLLLHGCAAMTAVRQGLAVGMQSAGDGLQKSAAAPQQNFRCTTTRNGNEYYSNCY